MIEAIKIHGKSWTKIRATFFPEKSVDALKKFWERHLEKKASEEKQIEIKQKKWSPEEIAKLKIGFKKYGHRPTEICREYFPDRTISGVRMKLQRLEIGKTDVVA